MCVESLLAVMALQSGILSVAFHRDGVEGSLSKREKPMTADHSSISSTG